MGEEAKLIRLTLVPVSLITGDKRDIVIFKGSLRKRPVMGGAKRTFDQYSILAPTC